MNDIKKSQTGVIGDNAHVEGGIHLTTVIHNDQKIIDIDKYLWPFYDAIINIEHDENNHIRIMNHFFEEQKRSISIIKTFSDRINRTAIENAWNEYLIFYNNTAKGRVLSCFAKILPESHEKQQKKLLRNYMENIINSVKK